MLFPIRTIFFLTSMWKLQRPYVIYIFLHVFLAISLMNGVHSSWRCHIVHHVVRELGARQVTLPYAS